MLSIKEVARLTGLSTATVSRALDPRYADRVKPSTREKILAVCDSADFRPDAAARSFVTGKSYKVGFISGSPASDCGNRIFGCFLQGVTFELQKNNYNLLLLGAHPDGEEQIINFLRSNVADAYILGNSLVTENVAEVISRCKAPVLMLEKQQSIPHALILRRNIRPAFEKIWKNIPVGLYDRVLFCSQPNVSSRYETAQGCAPAGVKIPLLLLESGKEFPETRYLARQAALKQIDYLKKFKIFWCSSDLLALGVRDALEETTGQVAGKDFYLIGFDNMESMGQFYETPFLSTVDNRMEKMGEVAARMLLDTLQGVKTADCMDFSSVYIQRKSFPDIKTIQKENSMEKL
ncbi:MAG: LacI family DNA-binding transcriptional regulator [Lentisphaeria bacterium]|nr:LacI family DNA-binding transcriptional regulator [Lentisphaeria bacterium]